MSDLVVIQSRRTPGRRSGAAAAVDCGPRRPSRRGRWRALSLGLVYVAAAIHFIQWKVTGTTLTPVEPSEAMQTLGSQALLNTGFVLFVVLILSTFVFGRFFCGWGCHIVALQDLCGWLLRKAGIPAKPFRSRLLAYVPLLAAVWMFVVPTLVRLHLGQAREPLRAAFTTQEFWARFPSLPVALLTFAVCGFVIVYLLGNKGFCTYACPYGGIFGLADPLAPGRIRVTDACEGCGHCTATCTSNVRVHEEVRQFGMVVNPGCMKCMDCVSVCPMDALYFGFGPPALAKPKPRTRLAQRSHDFTWPEEIAMSVLFVFSIVTLWGLYDQVPFLLALGLAALSAAVLLAVSRVFYVRDVRFARVQLRKAGRLQPAGFASLGLAVMWIAFLADAGVVKATEYAGFQQLEGHRRAAAAGTADTTHSRRAVELLKRSQRLTLVPTGRVEAGIAEAAESLGDSAAAEAHTRRAIALAPGYSEGRVRLARMLAARGETDSALVQLRAALEVRPDTPDAAGELADLLVNAGREQEAATVLEDLVKRRPHTAPIRVAYGVVLARLGEIDRGIAQLRLALRDAPQLADAHLKLGQVLANQDRMAEALPEFESALELEPGQSQVHVLAARIAFRIGRIDDAVRHLNAACQLEPFDPQIVGTWAALLGRTGGLAGAIEAAEQSGPNDRAARFRLLYLYRLAGRAEDAARIASGFPEVAPPTGSPAAPQVPGR